MDQSDQTSHKRCNDLLIEAKKIINQKNLEIEYRSYVSELSEKTTGALNGALERMTENYMKVNQGLDLVHNYCNGLKEANIQLSNELEACKRKLMELEEENQQVKALLKEALSATQ